MLDPGAELFGHDEAQALLARDFASGRPAHGWILSGPKGIGKAMLATRFAHMALAGATRMDASIDHPVFRRMAARSHSDFLVVEPAFDAKKQEAAQGISVEQARTIAEFLSLTPGEGAWRVVIVDSADALNAGGANAILKILEEPPPQALLLLIAHDPGKLLPTIRSRCRVLKLKPLNQEEFLRAMRRDAPELEPQALHALSQLAQGSPGIAQQLHEQKALEFYEQMLECCAMLPNPDMLKIHALAERCSAGQTHAVWQLFTFLALKLVERACKQAAGAGVKPLSQKEETVLRSLATLHAPQAWAEKWQQAADQFSLVSRLHLDYKQVMIVFFHAISSSEPFQLGYAA